MIKKNISDKSLGHCQKKKNFGSILPKKKIWDKKVVQFSIGPIRFKFLAPMAVF